jgi:hypothetical protein
LSTAYSNVFIYIYTRICLVVINNIFDFQLSVNIAYSAVECIQCYYVNYVILIIIVIPVWISVSLKTLVKSYRNARFWGVNSLRLFIHVYFFVYLL